MPKTILRKRSDEVVSIKNVIDIPDGYTTVDNFSDDCDGCDFDITFIDQNGDLQHKCGHPNILSAGCIDGRIIFKKIA